MKTTVLKEKDIQKKWYLVNAKEKTLGKLAVVVANTLRGKNKPYFSPHMDCGDYVIVINSKNVRLTGKKEQQKKYFRHSGYPGGLKEITFEKLIQKNPNEIIYKAVKGMLPKNKLSQVILKKLKVYPDEHYQEKAQKPLTLEI